MPESNDEIFSSINPTCYHSDTRFFLQHFKIFYANTWILYWSIHIDTSMCIDALILNLQYQYAHCKIMYCTTSMHHSIVPSLFVSVLSTMCHVMLFLSSAHASYRSCLQCVLCNILFVWWPCFLCVLSLMLCLSGDHLCSIHKNYKFQIVTHSLLLKFHWQQVLV